MAALTFNPNAFSELIELEEAGSAGLIDDLIGDYMKTSEVLVRAITDSARSLDLKLLERSAHSLKSSSRLLGVDALAEVAFRIEEAARAGSIGDDDVRALPALLPPGLIELARFRDGRK